MAREIRVPEPEGLHAEFYARARDGTLHLQRCADCGRYRHPPRHRCPTCGSDAWAWTPSPGRGVLWSWTVTHVAFDRGWADELPYATGVIELDEGVRLIGTLDGVDRARLRCGLPLRVRPERYGEAFSVLVLDVDEL